MTPMEELNKAISDALDNLNGTTFGTDEFSDALRVLQTLLGAREEMLKLDNDLQAKREQAAIDLRMKQLEVEAKERKEKADRESADANAKADRELREKEIEAAAAASKREARNRSIETGINIGLGVAAFATHEMLTTRRIYDGYQFEKTGIVSSPTFKGLLSGIHKKF